MPTATPTRRQTSRKQPQPAVRKVLCTTAQGSLTQGSTKEGFVLKGQFAKVPSPQAAPRRESLGGKSLEAAPSAGPAAPLPHAASPLHPGQNTLQDGGLVPCKTAQREDSVLSGHKRSRLELDQAHSKRAKRPCASLHDSYTEMDAVASGMSDALQKKEHKRRSKKHHKECPASKEKHGKHKRRKQELDNSHSRSAKRPCVSLHDSHAGSDAVAPGVSDALQKRRKKRRDKKHHKDKPASKDKHGKHKCRSQELGHSHSNWTKLTCVSLHDSFAEVGAVASGTSDALQKTENKRRGKKHHKDRPALKDTHGKHRRKDAAGKQMRLKDCSLVCSRSAHHAPSSVDGYCRSSPRSQPSHQHANACG